jgi:transposase
MRGPWELSDAQWKLIEPMLRPQRRVDGRGRPWQDTRAVLNGILWVLGTGAQSGELPKKCPPYQTCHRRFQQWVREGKLERILRVLAKELRAYSTLGHLPVTLRVVASLFLVENQRRINGCRSECRGERCCERYENE